MKQPDSVTPASRSPRSTPSNRSRCRRRSTSSRTSRSSLSFQTRLARNTSCVVLDDTIAVNIEKPKTKEEEDKLVNGFLSGLEKLMSVDDNWTFLQPFEMSMEHCAKCHTCSDACPIYEESGENELYRPVYRSEIIRRIYFKYIKKVSPAVHGDIDLNWETVARLIELSYRCNVCRRCAQTCPIGVDNALLSREIRKIASMEMGIVPKELHEDGSVLQLSRWVRPPG